MLMANSLPNEIGTWRVSSSTSNSWDWIGHVLDEVLDVATSVFRLSHIKELVRWFQMWWRPSLAPYRGEFPVDWDSSNEKTWYHNKPAKRGPPTKTLRPGQRALIRVAAQRPEVTLREVQSSQAGTGRSVHITTVSHTLHRAGLYGRVAGKGLYSQTKMGRLVFEFARRRVGNSPNVWRKVVRSDETTTKVFSQKGKHYAWHTKPTHLITQDHTGFSAAGKPVRVQGRRGCYIRDGLEQNRFRSVGDLRLGRRFTFQQDTDPKQSAKATLGWFKGKRVSVLEWPGQTLNQLKLEQFCLEEWANIPVARETYNCNNCNCGKDPYAPEDPPVDPYPKDPYVLEDLPVDDESFPDLECAVCFSQFNNVFNTPKMLECKHTFCLECLARMNVKSSQPETIQCPLCRAYTPLPTLGLPKLTTDPAVLSYLPEAMQRVYSIRFNRDRGKLQVKRAPSSLPPCPSESRHSVDLGMPADSEDSDRRNANASLCTRLIRTPLCRGLFMASGVFIMVSLTIGIVIILSKKN
ncbi:hypothetical protein NFI96_002787 [Prochilodus magdalenae]|nr:hypothetical protein NFI96_002787 [Prochilodus magdalenae]